MNLQKIESPQNQNFKRWKSLLEPKGIKKHGQFLLFGEKVIREAPCECIQEILLCEAHYGSRQSMNNELFLDGLNYGAVVPTKSASTKKGPESSNLPKQQTPNSLQSQDSIEKFEVSKELFKTLDIFGVASPIAVCQKPTFEKWNASDPATEGLTLLCPLGDPRNLGALIRSASAFSVENFVLLEEACSPYHPLSVRAASGGLFSLNFLEGPSIHDLPKQVDISNVKTAPSTSENPITPYERSLIILSLDGENINEFNWPESSFLLVGEEGPGVPDKISNLPNTTKLNIPITKNSESLNASIATSIALNSYRIKHPL